MEELESSPRSTRRSRHAKIDIGRLDDSERSEPRERESKPGYFREPRMKTLRDQRKTYDFVDSDNNSVERPLHSDDDSPERGYTEAPSDPNLAVMILDDEEELAIYPGEQASPIKEHASPL